MQTVTCPIDNKPCEPGCPDRYHDVPEGGCILTTAIESGTTVLLMLENTKESRPRCSEHRKRQGGNGFGRLISASMIP